jgi:inner membrane protein involved in colicin E2 resistance
MTKRIAAIVFIFLCITLAWVILGTTLAIRTSTQDNDLKGMVGQIWGKPQQQVAPTFSYSTPYEIWSETNKDGKTVREKRIEWRVIPISLDASDIQVDLNLEHRQKGLLWYSTYKVGFDGSYRVLNETSETRNFDFNFPLPVKDAVYDGFKIYQGDKEIRNVEIKDGYAHFQVPLTPGQKENIRVVYHSQGMDNWWYNLGGEVSQVRNFSLKMKTNFSDIDFPENSMSATSQRAIPGGKELTWNYNNLLSGVQIGMIMPKKLNPGPWASKIIFAAPVSLFLFFFLLLIFSTLKEVNLHPMHYFFIGAAFFSFHLLLAYLVDHISIHLAFIICSAVSIFLVVSYMRLVAGPRFAFLETGISQFIYLVLFSYTFFFEGFTGLAITVMCIITLYVVMQITAKVDWAQVFKK